MSDFLDFPTFSFPSLSCSLNIWYPQIQCLIIIIPRKTRPQMWPTFSDIPKPYCGILCLSHEIILNHIKSRCCLDNPRCLTPILDDEIDHIWCRPRLVFARASADVVNQITGFIRMAMGKQHSRNLFLCTIDQHQSTMRNNAEFVCETQPGWSNHCWTCWITVEDVEHGKLF